MHVTQYTSTDQELATSAMASLPAGGFLLVEFSVLYGCCGLDINMTRYNITPEPCGEDEHKDHCLTLDLIASGNFRSSATLVLLLAITISQEILK